jgi:uncharacterized secreted repeat protein (TIGR03808 family)
MATPLLHRRHLLGGLMACAGAALTSRPAAAAAKRRRPAQNPGGLLDAASRRLSAEGDQTALLQTLLDEVATTGEILFLPPGDYLCGPLRLPARARLAGIDGASRLFGPQLALQANGVRQLSLSHLTLDGLGRPGVAAGRHLVELVDCPDLSAEGCRFLGAAGHALALTAVGGRVSDCRITGAVDVALLSRDAIGLHVIDNIVEDCGNGGILVHRTLPGQDGSIVRGNRLARIRADAGGTGQYGNAINLFKAHGVTVDGNQIADSAFSAIRSNGGSNAVISGNTCLNSGETALYAEFQFEGAVISDNIVDGAAIGISVANFNEGGRLALCTGNLIRNLRTRGPYPADAPGFGMGISVEADTVVSNNVVENAPLFGLKLGWGPYLRDVAATGNVLRRCGTGIAVSVVEGAGRTLIASNLISDPAVGAILGYRWSEAVTADLARDPGSAPAHLSLSANMAG